MNDTVIRDVDISDLARWTFLLGETMYWCCHCVLCRYAPHNPRMN